jgi:hypothetical protein
MPNGPGRARFDGRHAGDGQVRANGNCYRMISRMSEHERVISRRIGRGGRPSKGPRTFVGLRLPDQLHEAVEEARAESGLTTNDFCIGLIQRAMEAGLIPSAQAPGQDRLPLSA